MFYYVHFQSTDNVIIYTQEAFKFYLSHRNYGSFEFLNITDRYENYSFQEMKHRVRIICLFLCNQIVFGYISGCISDSFDSEILAK